MTMKLCALLISIANIGLLLISQISNADQQQAEKKQSAQEQVKQVTVCSAGHCMVADKAYSTEALLNQFHQLFKANEGDKVSFCKADKATRTCKAKKVCHFVLGGIIPGSGCAEGITFHPSELSLQTAEITMKADMPLTFIGTPLACTTAQGNFSIRSPNDIALELKPHFCSWMAVGAMSAKFSFVVDVINVDRGEIGGYWKHSVKGTGLGSGSGYLLLQFPKNIEWQAMNTLTVEQALVQ
jgi:hypothetical protein